MKKQINLFYFIVIIVSSMFFNINTVHATWVTSDLNFDIEEFDVDKTNGELNFKGWAFVDHVDNWGGKNLSTYIVAYTGNWSDIGDSNISQCGNTKKKCLRFSSSAVSRDFFSSRCMGDGCGINRTRRNNIESGREHFITSTGDSSGVCTRSGSGSGVYHTGSYCLYYNVGFNSSISLKKIATNFAKNATIKFRIVSHVNGVGYRSLDLAVHWNSCGSWSDLNRNKKYYCKNHISYPLNYSFTDIDSENRESVYTIESLKVSRLEPEFHITAANGTAKLATGGHGVSRVGDYIFGSYNNFKIDTSKGIDGRIVNDGRNYHAVHCKKKSSYNDRIYGTVAAYTRGTGSSCAIPVEWGYIEGQLTLTNDFEIAPRYSCSCVGENCNTQGDEPQSCRDRSVSITDSCNSNEKTDCANGSFPGTDCTRTSSKDYYYQISSADLIREIEHNTAFTGINATNHNVLARFGVIKRGNDYLLPITFYGDTKYTQTASLNFYKEGSSGSVFANNTIEVDSGRFFNFALKYDVSATWSAVANTTQYRNKNQIKVQYKVGSQTKTKNITIYFDLGNNEDIYDRNGNKVGIVSEIGNLVASSASLNSSSVNNLKMTVSFPDSNTKESDLSVAEKNTNAGSFNCSVVSSTASALSASCKYIIKEAYINRKTANIYYGDSDGDKNVTMDNQGSLYYIPIYMKTGDVFDFNINSDKLSLISGITLKYNTTCKLKKVTNQLKTKVKYRTISVSNPFPNGGVNCNNCSKNWQEYYNEVGNLNRIKNTFSSGAISYQTKLLNYSDLSSLDATYSSDYTLLNEFSTKRKEELGQSDIINSTLFEVINGRKNNKYHCGLKEYDRDVCDQTQT